MGDNDLLIVGIILYLLSRKTGKGGGQPAMDGSGVKWSDLPQQFQKYQHSPTVGYEPDPKVIYDVIQIPALSRANEFWHKWVQGVVHLAGGLKPWLFEKGAPFSKFYLTYAPIQYAMFADINPFLEPDKIPDKTKGYDPNIPEWGRKSPHFPPQDKELMNLPFMQPFPF